MGGARAGGHWPLRCGRAAGCALVRDSERLRAALRQEPKASDVSIRKQTEPIPRGFHGPLDLAVELTHAGRIRDHRRAFMRSTETADSHITWANKVGIVFRIAEFVRFPPNLPRIGPVLGTPPGERVFHGRAEIIQGGRRTDTQNIVNIVVSIHIGDEEIFHWVA